MCAAISPVFQVRCPNWRPCQATPQPAPGSRRPRAAAEAGCHEGEPGAGSGGLAALLAERQVPARHGHVRARCSVSSCRLPVSPQHSQRSQCEAAHRQQHPSQEFSYDAGMPSPAGPPSGSCWRRATARSSWRCYSGLCRSRLCWPSAHSWGTTSPCQRCGDGGSITCMWWRTCFMRTPPA